MTQPIERTSGFKCDECGYTWLGKQMSDRSGPHSRVRCPDCRLRRGSEQVRAWDESDGELSDDFWQWLKYEHAPDSVEQAEA